MMFIICLEHWKSTSLQFTINIVFFKMISFEKLHNIQVFINIVLGKTSQHSSIYKHGSCEKLHNIQVFINMFPVENCAAVRAGFCPKRKWKQYISLLGT